MRRTRQGSSWRQDKIAARFPQDLRQHPRTDTAALYLLGWSHGGWTVLDTVALAGNGIPPPHLDALPDNPLQGLRGVFALYPYCGPGSYTRRLP